MYNSFTNRAIYPKVPGTTIAKKPNKGCQRILNAWTRTHNIIFGQEQKTTTKPTKNGVSDEVRKQLDTEAEPLYPNLA